MAGVRNLLRPPEQPAVEAPPHSAPGCVLPGPEAEPGVGPALSALNSPAAVAYLEHIARRSTSADRLRGHTWSIPDHRRVLARLERAGWIANVEGRVCARSATPARLRRHFENLVLRLALALPKHLLPAEAAHGTGPIDARRLLPVLAVAQRWAVFTAVAQGRAANVEIAAHLAVRHSLVSYHVRCLAEARLIVRGGDLGLAVQPLAAAELWNFFRLLELGWPYRPGTASPAPTLTLTAGVRS